MTFFFFFCRNVEEVEMFLELQQDGSFNNSRFSRYTKCATSAVHGV